MTRNTLVLLSRDTPQARETLTTHAARLRTREAVEEVRTLHYGAEPRRDLRTGLQQLAGSTDRAFVVPMVTAHTYETITDVPAALDQLDLSVRYCEPVGRSPAVTHALFDRAEEAVEESDRARPETLALVSLGSSSRPYHQQVTEYHADRLRADSPYEAVVTGYLVQNPAAECLRYNIESDRAVVVPLFVTGGVATNSDLPERLELDRGGLDYAAPLGTHPSVTDAIESELVRQRVLTDRTAATFEDALTVSARALATDGHGR